MHGCGGVGLSAIQIAKSLGCRVLAVDVNPGALELAGRYGAEVAVDARDLDVPAEVVKRTGGGAHLSVDALGSAQILANSVSSLRKRGRHVQVGLLVGEESSSPVPMSLVVARELEILGSHGMQARLFPGLFERIVAGELDPGQLVTKTCNLEEGAAALAALDQTPSTGITVINEF